MEKTFFNRNEKVNEDIKKNSVTGIEIYISFSKSVSSFYLFILINLLKILNNVIYDI